MRRHTPPSSRQFSPLDSSPLRFDELIWFDETRAVEPLAVGRRPGAEPPETDPFGL